MTHTNAPGQSTLIRRLAAQLARPHGLWGRVVGVMMNRANAGINQQSIELLALSAWHDVLEIGFGGGATLPALLERVEHGRVSGLEKSSTMLATARRNHHLAITSGSLDLVEGDASHLPWRPRTFDRVLTVNTLYFWQDPRAVFADVHRVLKPDGLFVLGYRPRALMDRLPTSAHGFALYDDADVERLMRAAGLDVVSVTAGGRRGHEHTCVVARPGQWGRV